MLEMMVLFLQDTSAIDSWSTYDPYNPRSEPFMAPCVEPSDTGFAYSLFDYTSAEALVEILNAPSAGPR